MLHEGEIVTIGASGECDIVVDQPQVSSRHARLGCRNGILFVEDLGSRNGLFVFGQRTAAAPVDAQTQIGFGTFVITVGELLQERRRAPQGPAEVARTGSRTSQPIALGPAREVQVPDGVLVIGREADCGLVVAEPTVGGRHARVFRNAGRVILEDLGSRNGTWVRRAGESNWESFKSAVLRRDDEVRVGSQVFRFKRPPLAEVAGARLDVQALTFTVTHKATGLPLTLLREVSFAALAGEVVGILGPSGSGKTSLLNILAGFDVPSSGEVKVQGVPLFANGNVVPAVCCRVGHAPQFDVAHDALTVEEVVAYSARLRGPANWSEADIASRVNNALQAVALEAKAKVPMGSEASKTLSGGQKKRVNIAMELVLDPPVLLLDEPTSGLSAHDTSELMRLLRMLADQGRTIVLTIHQPSYSAFVQMDQVLVLEEGGHVGWFGPAALDSFDFFGVTDREPGALLEQLPRKTVPAESGQWAQRYSVSDTKRQLVDGRARMLQESPPPQLPNLTQRTGIGQWATLLARNLTLKLRDRYFLALTMPVPALVAAIFAWVLGARLSSATTWSVERADLEHQYMLVLTIMACLFGALCAAMEIVTELAILRRERRGGVGIAAYVASKAATYALPAVVFSAVAVVTLKLLTGEVLQSSVAALWLGMAPAFFAAACAGLLLSAAASSQQGVLVLAVFYTILQVVFAVFTPLHVTMGTAPRATSLQAASAPMSARWALTGLVTSSDLCSDDDSGELPANLADLAKLGEARAFADRCQTGYYRDHGVEQVASREDRRAPKWSTKALVANLLLAGLALFGTGLILDRRSRGTQ